MKFSFIKSEKEEVIAYASEKNELIEKAEKLCFTKAQLKAKNINGYFEDDTVISSMMVPLGVPAV